MALLFLFAAIFCLVALFFQRWSTCIYCWSKSIEFSGQEKTYGFLTSFVIIYSLSLIAFARNIYKKSLWKNLFFGVMLGGFSGVFSYLIEYSFLAAKIVNEGSPIQGLSDLYFVGFMISIETFLRGTWLFGAYVGVVFWASYKIYIQDYKNLEEAKTAEGAYRPRGAGI